MTSNKKNLIHDPPGRMRGDIHERAERPGQMRFLGTWQCQLMVGLNDVKGLLQPKHVYAFMISICTVTCTIKSFIPGALYSASDRSSLLSVGGSRPLPVNG